MIYLFIKNKVLFFLLFCFIAIQPSQILGFERIILPENIFSFQTEITYQQTDQFYDNGQKPIHFLDKTLRDFKFDKNIVSGSISETEISTLFQIQVGLARDFNLSLSINNHQLQRKSNFHTTTSDSTIDFYKQYYQNGNFNGIGYYQLEVSQGFGLLSDHQFIYAINYGYTPERFSNSENKPKFTDGVDYYGLYLNYKYYPLLSDNIFTFSISTQYPISTQAHDHLGNKTSLNRFVDSTITAEYIFAFNDLQHHIQFVKFDQGQRSFKDSIIIQNKVTGIFFNYKLHYDNLLGFVKNDAVAKSMNFEVLYPISGQNISSSIQYKTSISFYF